MGAPLPCSLVKLVDIPEMNYYAKNGTGEVGWPRSVVLSAAADALSAQICMLGPSVFRGYLRDPERTAEALDGQGWLHSGDVGQWLPVRYTHAGFTPGNVKTSFS